MLVVEPWLSRSAPPAYACRGQVCCLQQTNFLGKVPGYKGRECQSCKGYRSTGRCFQPRRLFRQLELLQTACSAAVKAKLCHDINSTGLTPTTVLAVLCVGQELTTTIFVCMNLPGGGSRLQTLGGLNAQSFDSTLRTLCTYHCITWESWRWRLALWENRLC